MYILMDLDDVLIESTYRDISGNIRFLWSQSLEQDLGISESSLGKLFNEEWVDVITGRAELADRIGQFLVDIQSPVSVTAFLEYWMSHDFKLDPQAADWAKRLHRQGHYIYIASNQESQRVERISIKYPDVFSIVDGLFISAKLGVTKPAPTFFQKVISALGADPGSVILVDDSAKNLAGAERVGIAGFCYDRTDPDIKSKMKTVSRQIETVSRQI